MHKPLHAPSMHIMNHMKILLHASCMHLRNNMQILLHATCIHLRSHMQHACILVDFFYFGMHDDCMWSYHLSLNHIFDIFLIIISF
jgi:hypothetical protein